MMRVGSRRAVAGIAAVSAVVAGLVAAAPPSWWDNSDNNLDVLAGGGTSADNGKVANIGQAKWVATRAHAVMDETLPGGAGFYLHGLFPAPQATSAYKDAQYKPLNLGQLKYLAKPSYDRLMALGYDTRAAIETATAAPWSHPYPWDPSTPVAENYGAANLGQLKMAFSFDIAAAKTSDSAYRAVQWTGETNTTAAYPPGTGSKLEKTGGLGFGFDAGAAGAGFLYGDGAVRFTTPTLDVLVVGLSADNPDADYTGIDYGIGFSSGSVYILENGAIAATPSPHVAGESFEVRRDGSTVVYSQGGVDIYTSTVASTSPLLIDSSFYSPGNRIEGCECRGFSLPTDDSDGDGMPDGWEHAHNLDPNSHADPSADSDSDGFTDLQEYLADSDPNLASGTGSTPVPSDGYLLLSPSGEGEFSPVMWKDAVNTTPSYPAGEGSSLTKTSGSANNYDADAVSRRVMNGDGAVRFRAPSTTVRYLVGFAGANTNRSYTSLNYCIFVHSAGTFTIYESGVHVGTHQPYSAGDVFEVRRRGSTVEYLRNGNVVQTKTGASTAAMMVDCSFYTTGDTLADCMVSGFGYE